MDGNINFAGGAGCYSRPLNKIFGCVKRQHGYKNQQRHTNKKRGEKEPGA